ncbi:MAG: ArsR family transcriptional regulator [Myxococcaceae bacterium]|nr:MAG: ArsR family transcriptional regulator [Myxococcaceae bacterium]
MSSEANQDRVFKALSAGVRRAMLDALKDEPQTTGNLCERFKPLDRCTVMQHLKVLEGADLIIVQRKGRERWNHLNPLPIKQKDAPLLRMAAKCRLLNARVGPRVYRRRVPPYPAPSAGKSLP